jgi:MFS family permease
MSVIALLLAPIAGKMSDKIGGKYILMTGLALYGLGAAILVVQSSTDSNWPEFLPAIVVMGLGMGGIWAPMATEAMRGVPMMLAGAAAGVNNTLRQVGSVVGSAAVGALLQNQLASTLRDEATKRSGALPADVRSNFVEGFAASAKGGIDVGPSHAAAPSGLPAEVAAKIQQVGLEVFHHGYVRAMHPTLILPIAAAFVASALCLLATRHTTSPQAGGPAASPTAEGASAAATG